MLGTWERFQDYGLNDGGVELKGESGKSTRISSLIFLGSPESP